MPIIKIIPSKKNVNGIVNYITDKEKTDDEYTFCSGCSKETVEEDFKAVADYYHKHLGGKNRSYYHIIVSYNTRYEKISPEETQQMVEELCERTAIDNYQWFGTVHYKTSPDHVHCHLVVSNVAYKDSDDGKIKAGKSFQASRGFTRDLMEKGNEICKTHGYEHSLVNPHGRGEDRITQAEKALIAKGEVPWKDRLRMHIYEAGQKAESLDEFCYIMQDDYGVEVQEDRKGCFRYIPEEFYGNETRKTKPCHQRRLGDAYTKDAIELRIERKKEREAVYEAECGRYERERDSDRERDYGR